jgi:hypothetical protein
VFQLILPFQLELPFEAQAAGQAGPSELRPPRVRRARVRSGPASGLRVEAGLVTGPLARENARFEAQRDEAASAGLVSLEAAQP